MNARTHQHLLLNRYLLQKKIGSGGMSDIYLAKDIILERLVAIKRLRKDYSGDKLFQDRFKLEAKAAANLTHPNIVTVYDFGFDDGMPIIVMEYVSGVDLKVIIKNENKIEIIEAVKLMIQACAGIGYAHRAGLIHCDIKPQNLLVTSDLRLKVTDFGIARALTTIHPDEFHDVVWGSPLYFSPEQAAGSAPSPASDVYSLGIVLYEMLTGSVPFLGDTSEELVEKHKSEPPPHIRSKNPRIPPVLDQVLEKVLSKNPANRYRTADQFGRVLSTILNHSTDSLENSKSLRVSPALPPPILKIPTDIIRGRMIDWELVGWSLLSLITVGGLIPFWLFVYLSLVNPTR